MTQMVCRSLADLATGSHLSKLQRVTVEGAAVLDESCLCGILELADKSAAQTWDCQALASRANTKLSACRMHTICGMQGARYAHAQSASLVGAALVWAGKITVRQSQTRVMSHSEDQPDCVAKKAFSSMQNEAQLQSVASIEFLASEQQTLPLRNANSCCLRGTWHR